jgi:hypothetical protein
MIISTLCRRRTLPMALAGLGVVAVVSGCADSGGGEAAAPAASSAAATSESADPTASEPMSTNDELAAALLPAEAFGPDANVVTVDVRSLSTSASGGLPEGGSITPAECGQSVGATQLTPDDFGAIVAQSATSAAGVTVQVLAESEKIEGKASQFDELVAQCPQVTVNAPDGSTATVDFAALEVPDLGDSSDGIHLTIAVQGPDGTNLTIPSLLAVATDGQRLLFLQQTGASSAPLDGAAFTALLEQAFEAQREG